MFKVSADFWITLRFPSNPSYIFSKDLPFHMCLDITHFLSKAVGERRCSESTIGFTVPATLWDQAKMSNEIAAKLYDYG